MRRARKATRRPVAGAAAVVLLATAACGYHPPDNSVVHLADPGNCTPVDIAAAPDVASLLADAASHFNGSSAARVKDHGCAFVRVQTVDAPVALDELTRNWPDTVRYGPPPAAWVPGSAMWGELLDARLAARHLPAMAPNGTPFARTPLVVAMPAPMAHALGYPRRAIGWKELEQLAHDHRGWGAYGHPEWGPFRLGKGNPNWSTTGLDATVAIDASTTAAPDAGLLEQSVAYYADSTAPYFDNWQRLATTSTTGALTYLSAVITDERAVVAYNRGHAQADTAVDKALTPPAVPLVAIYPGDATIESDHPIIVLDAAWSSPTARTGARLFTKFALQRATQAKVAAAGFRPAAGTPDPGLLVAADGVDASARSHPVAPASPAGIVGSLDRWQTIRRRARVLFLLDVSDSMGDPVPGRGPTKLAVARAALVNALGQLGSDDEIGLRIFSTKLAGSAGRDWRDVVPTGTYAARRSALLRAIDALTPQQGSPLYAATRAAFDTVAQHRDRRRIDAVVLLTDGFNEDDHDTDLSGLLAHLGASPDVRVFTIAYGSASDSVTLRKMAQATGARAFDARNPVNIADVLPRVLASF